MLNQERGFSVPVDLIRTVAILGVLMLHSTNDLTPQVLSNLEIIRWSTVDVYQSIARMGVPLFVMLTGVLLLQPSKTDESLSVFFRKRVARLALPFLFWGALYYVYIYFAKHQAVTVNSIIQGYLTSPYLQFWYIYMLAGLYLLTPILRIFVAHANDKTMRYIIVVWLLSVSIFPTVGYFTGFNLDANVLTITGWIGYYLLGLYLLKVKIRRRILASFIVLGVALTALGTYYMAATVGGVQMFYFQEYFSPTMVFSSVMLFLLLNTVTSPKLTAPIQPDRVTQQSKPSLLRRLLHLISENTLPIFLLHLMVLESLLNGYFGFTLNGAVINSIIGVPILTIVVLFICLAIIVPLKKVPYLKKLIG